MHEKRFEMISNANNRPSKFNIDEFVERQIAYKRLEKQIRDGERPRASELLCADCNFPARHYHHESYKIPECDNVIPLCSSCHSLRHITKVRIHGFEDNILSYIKKHQDGVEMSRIALDAVYFEFEGKDILKNWNYDTIWPVVVSYVRRFVRSRKVTATKVGKRKVLYKIASPV